MGNPLLAVHLFALAAMEFMPSKQHNDHTRVCIMKDLFLLSISHVISYNSTMTTHVDIFQSLYNEGPVPSLHLSCYIL